MSCLSTECLKDSEDQLLSVYEGDVAKDGIGFLPRRHPLIAEKDFITTHDVAVGTLYDNLQRSVHLFSISCLC